MDRSGRDERKKALSRVSLSPWKTSMEKDGLKTTGNGSDKHSLLTFEAQYSLHA